MHEGAAGRIELEAPPLQGDWQWPQMVQLTAILATLHAAGGTLAGPGSAFYGGGARLNAQPAVAEAVPGRPRALDSWVVPEYTPDPLGNEQPVAADVAAAARQSDAMLQAMVSWRPLSSL